MDNYAIRLKNLTKEYKLYRNDKARFLGIFSKRVPYKVKKAVDNISLDIPVGDSIAILGRNGAGKSTVLKMITGVVYPTAGEIEVNGRVSALLELGAGFDPEFTGRENIYLKGQLMGLTEDEVDHLEPKIVHFADIGEYIDQPVREYSSGMKARLGFAINANIDPEILVVDEALSVGDQAFAKKCTDKVADIVSKDGVTVLFVTHSPNTAKDFVKRGIVMDNGKIVFDGPIDEAAAFYEKKYC